MKFTFKNEKLSPYSSYLKHTTIKLNRKECGSIWEKNISSTENEAEIRLMIVKNDKINDGNPNCSWMWITLKNKFASTDEAKQFLHDNIDKITQKYTLNLLND